MLIVIYLLFTLIGGQTLLSFQYTEFASYTRMAQMLPMDINPVISSICDWDIVWRFLYKTSG